MNDMAIHPTGGRTTNIISLCAGGAGLDLGVGLAIPSARGVCLVEREGYAVAQLVSAMQEGLLAQAPIWSDVRTFDGRPWRGLVDGIIGGIPCQPHSMAGRKQGSQDHRDLWSPTRRIIAQVRPGFVLIENVGGMLVAGDDEIAGAERVWRDLRKLGFKVEGGLFTAAEVGASHKRERFFILGVADDAFGAWGDAGAAGEPEAGNVTDRGCRSDVADRYGQQGRRQYQFESGDGKGARQQSDRDSQSVADTGDSGLQGRELGGTSDEWDWPTSSGSAAELREIHVGDTGSLADTGCIGIERRGGAGNLPEAATGGQGQGHQRKRDGDTSGDGVEALVDSPRELGTDITDGAAAGGQQVAALDRTAGRDPGGRGTGRNPSSGRRDEAEIGFRPLFAPGPGERETWRRILDAAPEFEPSFRRVADGLADRMDIGRVDRLRMLGNGVVPLQAAYAIRVLMSRLADQGSAGAVKLLGLMRLAA